MWIIICRAICWFDLHNESHGVWLIRQRKDKQMRKHLTRSVVLAILVVHRFEILHASLSYIKRDGCSVSGIN